MTQTHHRPSLARGEQNKYFASVAAPPGCLAGRLTCVSSIMSPNATHLPDKYLCVCMSSVTVSSTPCLANLCSKLNDLNDSGVGRYLPSLHSQRSRTPQADHFKHHLQLTANVARGMNAPFDRVKLRMRGPRQPDHTHQLPLSYRTSVFQPRTTLCKDAGHTTPSTDCLKPNPKTSVRREGGHTTPAMGLLKFNPNRRSARDAGHSTPTIGWLKRPPNVRLRSDTGH